MNRAGEGTTCASLAYGSATGDLDADDDVCAPVPQGGQNTRDHRCVQYAPMVFVGKVARNRVFKQRRRATDAGAAPVFEDGLVHTLRRIRVGFPTFADASRHRGGRTGQTGQCQRCRFRYRRSAPAATPTIARTTPAGATRGWTDHQGGPACIGRHADDQRRCDGSRFARRQTRGLCLARLGAHHDRLRRCDLARVKRLDDAQRGRWAADDDRRRSRLVLQGFDSGLPG